MVRKMGKWAIKTSKCVKPPFNYALVLFRANLFSVVPINQITIEIWYNTKEDTRLSVEILQGVASFTSFVRACNNIS